MPQWGTGDYKQAVFQQLAQGSGGDDDHFQHFENFSAGAPGATSRRASARRSTPRLSTAPRSSRSSAPRPRKCTRVNGRRSRRT